MSLAVNSNATGSLSLPGARAASTQSIASLNGQIQQFKQQLDDWTTCVSAKTTKGQAEIQRLSGELSGAEDRVKRLAAVPARSIDVWA
jgi:hypothetical protein